MRKKKFQKKIFFKKIFFSKIFWFFLKYSSFPGVSAKMAKTDFWKKILEQILSFSPLLGHCAPPPFFWVIHLHPQFFGKIICPHPILCTHPHSGLARGYNSNSVLVFFLQKSVLAIFAETPGKLEYFKKKQIFFEKKNS